MTFHARVYDDVDDDCHGNGYHGKGNVPSFVVVLRYFSHEVCLIRADEDHATVVAPKKNVKETLLEKARLSGRCLRLEFMEWDGILKHYRKYCWGQDGI